MTTTNNRNANHVDTESAEFKALVEAQVAAQLETRLAEELAKRPVVEATGYKSYATKAIPPKAAQFAEWIGREFAALYPQGLNDRDARLVMIAIRTYRNFQQEVNPK
jgi:hypothetical protein